MRVPIVVVTARAISMPGRPLETTGPMSMGAVRQSENQRKGVPMLRRGLQPKSPFAIPLAVGG